MQCALSGGSRRNLVAAATEVPRPAAAGLGMTRLLAFVAKRLLENYRDNSSDEREGG